MRRNRICDLLRFLNRLVEIESNDIMLNSTLAFLLSCCHRLKSLPSPLSFRLLLKLRMLDSSGSTSMKIEIVEVSNDISKRTCSDRITFKKFLTRHYLRELDIIQHLLSGAPPCLPSTSKVNTKPVSWSQHC